MKALSDWKHDLGDMWGSISEGWRNVRERASTALTSFKPSASQSPADPAGGTGTDLDFLAGPSWAMLAGEVFEDSRRVVVKLEAPGMEGQDFDIQVQGDALVVRGEKRAERESGDGRYRVRETAYGSFYRSIPLPGAVIADKAQASYRNGVLRVELPKSKTSEPRSIEVKVR